MKTETLWSGERRAARMHWWRQVLEQPMAANWNDLLDEMVSVRFGLAGGTECGSPEAYRAGSGC